MRHMQKRARFKGTFFLVFLLQLASIASCFRMLVEETSY
jgi:hypothetical protein